MLWSSVDYKDSYFIRGPLDGHVWSTGRNFALILFFLFLYNGTEALILCSTERGVLRMERAEGRLDLPGFRFHPTEEELLDFYLNHIVHGSKLNFDVIGTLNIYLYDPRELPGLL